MSEDQAVDLKADMEALPYVTEDVDADYLPGLFAPRLHPTVERQLNRIGDLVEQMTNRLVELNANLYRSEEGRISKKRERRFLTLLKAYSIVMRSYTMAVTQVNKEFLTAYREYLKFLQQMDANTIAVLTNYVPSYAGDSVAVLDRYKLAKSEFYTPKSTIDEIVAVIRAFLPQLPEGIVRKMVEQFLGKFTQGNAPAQNQGGGNA